MLPHDKLAMGRKCAKKRVKSLFYFSCRRVFCRLKTSCTISFPLDLWHAVVLRRPYQLKYAYFRQKLFCVGFSKQLHSKYVKRHAINLVALFSAMNQGQLITQDRNVQIQGAKLSLLYQKVLATSP